MQRHLVRQPLIILISSVLVISLLSIPAINKYLPSALKNNNVFTTSNLKKDSTANTTTTNTFTSTKTKATKEQLIEKLSNAKKTNKKVHIAYLGDSFIEADLITDDLRQLLQKQYGGNGIGFIPIQTISAGMQRSIKHSFSNDWTKITTSSTNNTVPLMLSSSAFKSSENSWVQYSAATSFDYVTIYTGSINTASTLTITINDKDTTVVLPVNTKLLNTITLHIPNAKKFKITCHQKEVLFYGCNFEDNSGAFIDNYSLRGANGTQLLKLDTALTNAFATTKHYDLVIVQYGVNVIGNNNTKFDWYALGLQKTIDWLKLYFKNTPILIISTSDKATKLNGNYTTDAGVPVLVALQQQIAQKNELLFFNLFKAMGGNQSIVQWANENTPLAYKDYTHITYKGAKRIADSLYSYLISTNK